MMNPTILLIAALAVAAGVVGFLIFKKRKNNSTEVPIKVKPNTSNRKPIKKALLVGINKYKPELGADLRGCVNDVEAIRRALLEKYDFDPENIRVVNDDRATKQGIIERLQWLINDTKSGDVVLFHFSGHGSQVRDRNGDELNDHLDEILCPHDLNWDDPLTDDMLSAIFSKAPAGVTIIMFADCCHSGTITRDLNPFKVRYSRSRRIIPPFDIKSRSLGKKLPKRKITDIGKSANQVLLISGCKDDQTSADAYINGKYNGALSWALYTTLMGNTNLTYKELHDKVVNLIKSRGFSQDPQLSGPDYLLNKKIFT